MNTEISSQGNLATGNDYRYKHFTTRLLFRDLRFGKTTTGPGDALPRFQLVTTEGDPLGNDDLPGDKPLLLVFGSMTCPNTASAAPHIQRLYEKLGDRVKFIMVYSREAHPGEHIGQAETLAEKLDHARALKNFFEIDWTVAVDTIDGDLHRALDPKPNSAILVNSQGTIVYRSLWAADRAALQRMMQAVIAGQQVTKTQSVALFGPVAKAMGQVQKTMQRGGPQAVKDLWVAGFPIALAGRIASLFFWLSPDRRGLMAVATMMLGMVWAIRLVI
jgi:thiol-disulfide isomerase/thioredoxin